MKAEQARPSRPRESKAIRARRHRQRRRQLVVAGGLAVVVAAFVAAASMLPSGGGGLNTSTHQHPHLEIFIQGEPVAIPVNIGIDPSLYHDHTFDEYSGMDTMSPLHTHEGDGTIHMEMSRWHPLTLGDFFSVWGQPFGPNQVLHYTGPVTMTVDGEPSSEYGGLILQEGQRIVVHGG
ncbi:MAG TPA: hypothetical protein VGB42_03755 [Candidatus Thermoplasmatota archaeon]